MPITQLMPAPPGLTNELLLEFFLVFSRFEYAMKAAGWTRLDVNTAQPDWQRLINEVQAQDHAVTDPLLEAGAYLFRSPPKKQIRRPDGSIGWEAVRCDNPERRVAFLLRSVKGVRNNLFHGGKFELLTNLPDRNERLVSDSLRVLELLLELPILERLRKKYFEYAEEWA